MRARNKAGTPVSERPAVCPSAAGSHGCGEVFDRTKLRALAEAIGGPCIVRDTDGNGFLLTAERLQFIPLSHGSLSA